MGAFGTVWSPYETRCKTGRTSAKVRATKSRWNVSQQMHPVEPIGPKTDVLYYLGAFGTVWLPYETRCKTGRTSAKVRATKSRSIFRNECIRSTPFDPKLTFWFVSYHLGAFRTVWLLHETRWKTGRTSAKVSNTKSRRNFWQQTHLIQPIRP